MLSREVVLALLWLGLAGLFAGCRSPNPKEAEGVLQSERTMRLTGKAVPVDFYLPLSLKKAPVVVVAHGFSRSRRNMAGWGTLLASNGFIVAIPDLPAWADHDRNSRAVRELFGLINSKTVVAEPEPTGTGALLGYSMGGLCTLLAATNNAQVQCWVGLDPVDAGSKGAVAAKELRIPCVALLAEPGRCNANDNATGMLAGTSGPRFVLRVRDARHTDPEQPTDWLAEMVCGRANPARHAVFERYAIAALRAVFHRDAESLHVLTAATNDPAVKDVSVRALGKFGD